MEEGSVITCAVILDWLNAQGTSIRKATYRTATLRLIRSDTKEIFVEITPEKAATVARLLLQEITVHNKFMNEGKASIKFNREKCMLFLSNAPPGLLANFLRTLIIKLKTVNQSNGQDGSQTNNKGPRNIQDIIRNQNPNSFQDISPVTNNELVRTKKSSLAPNDVLTTPPSGKRKRPSNSSDENTVKKACLTLMNEELDIQLNDEQNTVLKACVDGKSIFFTGSAGTGKSFLLKKIISVLPPDGTVATASTGAAACLIGGVTLHSFAGIGAGEATLQRCYDLAARPASAQTWRKCKRLIIDEISMVDGEYFEKIEAVARFIRRNDKPFGGIQLILCGDFFQLPPVIKKSDQSGGSKRFCFQTETWEKVINASFELKIVHRQKDSEFVRILNFIRIGHVTDEMAKRLMATATQKIETNDILATQLCSHTSDSDLINESKLNGLSGEERIFIAQDSDSSYTKQMDSQILASSRLVLKVKAQVMLLKNINIADGLVNGARGVVVGFAPNGGSPIVQFMNKRKYVAKPEKWTIKTPFGSLITRKQVPLKLAWAFSIHKSQGLTLDCVEMSLSKVFEAGQAYVALSRAQSLNSIRVLDFDAKQVWADANVLRFYKSFRRQLHEQIMIPLGRNTKTTSKDKDKDSRVLKSKAFRTQPLVNIC